MGIGATTRAAILDLVFLASAWADYAQNDGSGPETNISFALATADYTASGTMDSNEATYTSYARQDVPRSGSGFTRTANSISPNSDIQFPIGTGGSETITHFACGHTANGGGEPTLWYGTVTPTISAGTGVRPILLSTSTLSLT